MPLDVVACPGPRLDLSGLGDGAGAHVSFEFSSMRMNAPTRGCPRTDRPPRWELVRNATAADVDLVTSSTDTEKAATATLQSSPRERGHDVVAELGGQRNNGEVLHTQTLCEYVHSARPFVACGLSAHTTVGCSVTYRAYVWPAADRFSKGDSRRRQLYLTFPGRPHREMFADSPYSHSNAFDRRQQGTPCRREGNCARGSTRRECDCHRSHICICSLDTRRRNRRYSGTHSSDTRKPCTHGRRQQVGCIAHRGGATDPPTG